MTEPLYRADAYLTTATARVIARTGQGGLILDRSVFYPAGGGQPGDSGALEWSGGRCRVATTVKGEGADIVCVPEEGETLPEVGAEVQMALDWDRRHAHMRVHTALHLLSVVVPFGVTGGAIAAGKGRLDFDMADPPQDKEALTAALNEMVATDALVSEDWITEAQLDAQPDLVKTLSVAPPRGTGHIRLIRIGDPESPLDLQPCGGTHVRSLGEIGRVNLGKVEKKGRMNRRIHLHLEA